MRDRTLVQTLRLGYHRTICSSPQHVMIKEFVSKEGNRDEKVMNWSIIRQACSPLIQLFFGFASDIDQTNINRDMTQLLLLGKFEYGGRPIFKVVLEC